MDIGTARVVVHKDIHSSFPPTMAPPTLVNPMIVRPIKTEMSTGSEEDMQRIATRDGKDGSQKNEFAAKSDSLDNMFIEDVGSSTVGLRRELISLCFSSIPQSPRILGRRWCGCGLQSMSLGLSGWRRGTRRSLRG